LAAQALRRRKIEKAIRIAIYNGARLLEQDAKTGSLGPGDVRKVRIVFKDGVGYDSPAILNNLAGQIGAR